MSGSEDARNVAHLVAIGLRMHARGLLTAATITLGFFTFGFIMSSIWAGNVTLGATLRGSGSPNVLLVLSEGAETVAQSRLGSTLRSALVDAAALPGVAAVSERTAGTAQLEGGTCPSGGSVSLLADEPITPSSRPALRTDVHSGASLAKRCGLSAGNVITVAAQPMTIDAVMPANGTVEDSMLVMSVATVRRLLGTGAEPNAGVVRTVAGDAERVRQLVLQRTGSRAEVVSEREYYRRQAGQLLVPTLVLTLEVGGLMLVGAVIALLLSMHTTISSRLRALAILIALGFTPVQIAAALAIEGAVFALVGSGLGLLAALLTWSQGVPLFDLSTNAQLTISLSPTPGVAIVILVCASCLGLAATSVLATRMLIPAVDNLPMHLRART